MYICLYESKFTTDIVPNLLLTQRHLRESEAEGSGSIRRHTYTSAYAAYAYVSIHLRESEAEGSGLRSRCLCCHTLLLQHTPAYVYVSIRQHTSAYVRIRQHTSA
jgi:hypothetical protein